MGVIDVPFAIPNLRCETGEAEAHSRIGWFRSVRNIPHGFAIQSFVAEIAHALGRDPKDMLLELIGPARIFDPRKSQGAADWTNYGEPFETYPIDTGRLRRVVELVAEQADWGRQVAARARSGDRRPSLFVSYVATVVEVAVDNKGKLTVPRVDTAIDCGFAANPERIRSQIEGAAVMGLSHRQIRRDHVQERARAAEQFRQLSGRPHRRVAGDHACAHHPGDDRRAVERGRRARVAALCAGAVQCDLCRDRQAHPAAADRRSAGELSPRRIVRAPSLVSAMTDHFSMA